MRALQSRHSPLCAEPVPLCVHAPPRTPLPSLLLGHVPQCENASQSTPLGCAASCGDMSSPCPPTTNCALPIDSALVPGHSPRPPEPVAPAVPSTTDCNNNPEPMPQALVEVKVSAGNASTRWHSIKDTSSDSSCSGSDSAPFGPSIVDHVDDCALSLPEAVDLIDSKCGFPKYEGDWQQRICWLRQLCQFFDAYEVPGVSSEYLHSLMQAMRELQHSLAKIATLPPLTPTTKPSGSARDKLRRAKLEAGEYIGCDILKALINLKEPKVGYNLLQFARFARCLHP